MLGAIPRDVPGLRSVEKFSSVAGGEPLSAFITTAPETTAFLQFTSGSTASPKGVQVTHGNLSANLAMIRLASQMDERSCCGDVAAGSITTWASSALA